MASTTQIQLVAMPQLAEATSKEDDWTGTTDATERRRIQTRLNTRAYRKRKALTKKAEATNSPIKPDPLIECWDIKHDSVSIFPAPRVKQLYNSRTPLLLNPNSGSDSDPDPNKPKNLIFPLCPDHLITLVQFNALRALATNRSLVSRILATPLDCNSEEIIHVIPYPSNPNLLPPSLLPTLLQQTTPHGDWIDIFPCPEGRDRLIRAAGTFDEDELWADCIGGLFEGFPNDEIERRGMVAWEPPWDITGWEMSEGFVRKWGWLVRGVPGVLEATNRWRGERGEAPLGFR